MSVIKNDVRNFVMESKYLSEKKTNRTGKKTTKQSFRVNLLQATF